MSKMSEMSATIEELAGVLLLSTTRLTGWRSSSAAMSQAEAEPAEPILTLEAVRAVLADKSRAGFTAQIRSLLQKYGADKLSG